MWKLACFIIVAVVYGTPIENKGEMPFGARTKRCWICSGDEAYFDAPPILSKPTNKGTRERRNNAYGWGYAVSKDRGHVETKDSQGVVTGIVNFVNPKGQEVQWTYSAHPEQGFKVTEYNVDGVNVQKQFVPSVVPQAKPVFKSAIELGKLRVAGSDGVQTLYDVDQELYDSAGSVSQLAHNLGAIPLAPVHDARAPPKSYSKAQTLPLLIPYAKNARDDKESFYLMV